MKVSPETQPDDKERAESLASLQSQPAPILSPIQLTSLMGQVRGDLAIKDAAARKTAALKAAGIADP